MTINRDHIQKAFAAAHKAGKNPEFSHEARLIFQGIAQLIWRSCGDDAVKQADLCIVEPAQEGK